MKRRYLAAVVFLIVIAVVSSLAYFLVSYLSSSRAEVRYSEQLRLIDSALTAGDRIRAERYIRDAAHLADSEFTYLRVMRRARTYYEKWDAPSLLFDVVKQAVADVGSAEQRFWALAVDAALQNSQYVTAKDWALERLRHTSFQNLVLEAVLRGGGVAHSDGSEFGDLLLMLSNLLDNPTADDFIQAAEVTADSRYAVNAVLKYLTSAAHAEAHAALTDFPAIKQHSPNLAVILLAELGFIEQAYDIFTAHPPNPDQYFLLGLDRVEAELRTRLAQYEIARQHWQELSDSQRYGLEAYLNQLYTMQRAGAPFTEKAQLMLDIRQHYPAELKSVLAFMRWYNAPDEPISPFEPLVAQYHSRLRSELVFIESMESDAPVVRLFDIARKKAELGPERYLSQLWLMHEQHPDIKDLHEFIFFQALSLQDRSTAAALMARLPENLHRYRLYYHTVFGSELDNLHTDASVADPYLLHNRALLALHHGELQSAVGYLNSALERTYAIEQYRNTLLSHLYTVYALYAILSANMESAQEYLDKALTADPSNTMTRRVKMYMHL